MRTFRLVPALGVLTALCAACTDEVPVVPDSELYHRAFVKEFGAVDPGHDWNLAEQAAVDVTTDRPSRIKITAQIGDTRYLLADYADVMGSRKLTFDIPRGISDIRVSNELHSFNTTTGSSVDFTTSGRAIWEKKDNVVEISRVDYRFLTEEGVTAFENYLPEGKDNLGKVTQNFTFVANGDFTIYPVYWQTAAYNTLGIYYIDEVANEMVCVPFYTNKITPVDGTKGNLLYNTVEEKEEDLLSAEDNIPLKDSDKPMIFELNPSDYNSAGKTSFLDFDSDDWKVFKRRWLLKARENYKYSQFLYQQDSKGNSYDKCFDLSYLEDSGYLWDNSFSAPDFYIKDAVFEAEDATSVKLTNIAVGSVNHWTYPGTAEKSHPGKDVKGWKSRGIHIHIEPGTKFGMYIRVWNNGDDASLKPSIETVDIVRMPLDQDGKPVNDGHVRYYSEAKYNPTVGGSDVFASTYMYDAPSGTYRVLGFEDWGHDVHDLNDMMFFVTSAEPEEIPDVEDIDNPKMSWILALEDLGVVDDFDFNDLVLKIEHVAGQKTATVTPLAAGGTLPMRIFYKDREIRGEDNFNHVNEFFGESDHTVMFNTGRATAKAKSVEIEVDADFSMANLQGVVDSRMGGFHVQVKQDEKDPSGVWTEGVIDIAPAEIVDETIGAVPQMICVPGSWKWPKERVKISLAYPSILGWFKDKEANKDWYLYPESNLVWK